MRQLSYGPSAALALTLLAGACGGNGARSEERQQSASASPERASVSRPSAPVGRCELPESGYMADCNSCLATHCCAPIEACKNDPECMTQLDCDVGCQYASDPETCYSACLQGAPPHPDYNAYDDCSFSECRSNCWM